MVIYFRCRDKADGGRSNYIFKLRRGSVGSRTPSLDPVYARVHSRRGAPPKLGKYLCTVDSGLRAIPAIVRTTVTRAPDRLISFQTGRPEFFCVSSFAVSVLGMRMNLGRGALREYSRLETKQWRIIRLLCDCVYYSIIESSEQLLTD